MAVTITHQHNRIVKQAIFDWVSAADGTATGQTDFIVNGEILKILTNPDAVAPTDLYDLTLTDDDAFDVAGGLIANRSTTNTEIVIPMSETTIGARFYAGPIYVDSALTLNVTNAGNAKAGRVRVYYR
jgi:hypothetical protein